MLWWLVGLAAGFPVPGTAQELLPDLRPDAPRDVALAPRSGGRVELRFTTLGWNLGEGPVELRGGAVLPDGTRQEVYQRVYRSDGGFSDQLSGYFIHHPEHEHTHFEDYALYVLEALDVPIPVPVGSAKTSFCLMDTQRVVPPLPGSPTDAVYAHCDSEVQGISAGWGDAYSAVLPGQSIDVTGFPAGTYRLTIQLDPLDQLRELDDGDNASAIRLLLDPASLSLSVLGADVPAAVPTSVRIAAIFAGGGASGDAQYVELRAAAAGQNLVHGHALRVYGASGAETARVEFPGSLPNGAEQMSFLIANPAAVDLFGLAPDLVLPPGVLERGGGKLCWDAVDCAAWGSYAGPPGSGGTAVGTPLDPLPAGIALRRRRDVFGNPLRLELGDDTGNSRSDFAPARPEPTGNSGVSGPVDGDAIAPALDNCAFFANPAQSDTDVDGRGNDCECGDQSGDGRNSILDLVAINSAIFNPASAMPLCDGNGDALCDVSDIVAANLEIFSPKSTSTCARQPVPDP